MSARKPDGGEQPNVIDRFATGGVLHQIRRAAESGHGAQLSVEAVRELARLLGITPR